MNMMRGAGIKGLSGIPPVRDNVIRPLLYVPKRDIVSALDAASIPYVIDSPNLESDYKRNFIRNELLSKFNRLSEDPEEMVTRLCRNLRSDADFIDGVAGNFMVSHADDAISRDELLSLHPAVLSRVISLMAHNGTSSGVETVHVLKISELLNESDNFEVCLPGSVSFVCSSGVCKVETPRNIPKKEFDHILKLGENYIPEIDAFVILSLSPDEICSSNVYKISIKTSLDFDIIKGGVRVRSKRDGDSYVYGGMTRKLKKLFNDKGVPTELRSSIPVFYDDSGILWVKGFSVRDGGAKKTDKRLYISIHEKQA